VHEPTEDKAKNMKRTRRMMRYVATVLVVAVTYSVPAAGQSEQDEQRLVAAPQAVTGRYGKGVWPSIRPQDCPFEKSLELVGLEYTGRHRIYTNADTWYPSWAEDGHLYSPWTDGTVGRMRSSSGPKSWTTGHAKIVGQDPLSLEVIPLGTHHAPATPYGGRYPCGSLVHNGLWYYGTYCLDKHKYPWDIMGPFVGFRISSDCGETWMDTPCTPDKPLFGESGKEGAKVRMGSPHVVDFGRNMEHSPDGKMYLTGHGATRPGATCSWISGDQVYVARVTPGVDNVNDETKYEFFSGHDASGEPIWSRAFAEIQPLLEWNDRLGCVTATWNAPLDRFLMCVTDGQESGTGPFDTMILEAERITGPWRLVALLEKFGGQAYFVNVPSKFISSDGRTVWLCFASNWIRHIPSDPPEARYGMCMYEVRLLSPRELAARKPTENEAPPPNPLDSPANVGRKAKATASSHYPECPPGGAVNGIVGGLPGAFADEWSAQGEHVGAWLKLTWDRPQTVNRVWLFDRPSDKVQVTAAELHFSDGSQVDVRELPDDARQGREIRFPGKTVEWLEVRITGTKDNHPYIGISEIAVFADNPTCSAADGPG